MKKENVVVVVNLRLTSVNPKAFFVEAYVLAACKSDPDHSSMTRGRILAGSCWQRFIWHSRSSSITSPERQWIIVPDQNLRSHKFVILSKQSCSCPFSTGSTDSITCSDSAVGKAHQESVNASKQGSTKDSAAIKCISGHTETLRQMLAVFDGRGWEPTTEEALGQFSKGLTPKLVAHAVKGMETDLAMSFFKWAERQDGYKHSKQSYSMLFRRFVESGDLQSAMEIFNEMKDHRFKINSKTVVSLAHHCGKAGMAPAPAEMLELMKSFDIAPDLKVYRTLLNDFLEVNDQDRADKLVQEILNEGAGFDIDSSNALLSTYAKFGKAEGTLKILEDMERKGCTPNVQTYNILIKCFCEAKRVDQALELFAKIREKGLIPDVGTYNTLINVHCQAKRVDEALKLLADMKEIGCCPNVSTHNILVTGYLKSKQVEKALMHLEKMSVEGCKPSLDTERVLVIHLCKLREVDKALHFFEMTAERGETMFPDACNSLLLGLCKAGRLDDAFKVFDKMQGGVCRPDLSSYTILIRSCCNLYKLDKARELFDDTKKKGVTLPVDVYVVLLHAFSRASKFRQVGEICDDLLVNCPRLEGRKGTAILDALNMAQRVDEGLRFCDYIMESNLKVQPRQLKRLTYLLNRRGRSSDASNLNRAMLEKGCVVVSDNLNSKTECVEATANVVHS